MRALIYHVIFEYENGDELRKYVRTKREAYRALREHVAQHQCIGYIRKRLDECHGKKGIYSRVSYPIISRIHKHVKVQKGTHVNSIKQDAVQPVEG